MNIKTLLGRAATLAVGSLLLFTSVSRAQVPQTKIYLSDGSGNILTLSALGSGGGTLTLPSGGGTLLTMVGGNSSLGTVTSGTWQGTMIGSAYGGTGLTSYATGDILYASATNTLSALPIGGPGQVLEVVSGVPSWQTVGGTGTVTNFTSGNLSPVFTTSVATSTTTPALTFALSNAGPHTFLGNSTGTSAAPTYSAVDLSADVTGLLPISALNTTGTASSTTYLRGDGAWTTLPAAPVTSVSNSDGSLTISPTTGDVVASLNVANPNTWTGAQSIIPGANDVVGLTIKPATAFDKDAFDVLSLDGSTTYLGVFPGGTVGITTIAVKGGDINGATIGDLLPEAGTFSALTSTTGLTLGSGANATTLSSAATGSAKSVNLPNANGNLALVASTTGQIMESDVSGLVSDLASKGSGTVTSVNVAIPGMTSSGAVTTSGTISMSGALAVANGGTNSSAALTNNKVMISSSGAIVEGPAWAAGSPGTLTANITGSAASATTAAGLSSTLAVTSGGTGTGTAPTSAQILVAQSGTAYAPETVGGDATITTGGNLVVTKTNGVAFGSAATANTSAFDASGAATTAVNTAVSGTSGKLAVFNGTNSVTSGPAYSSGALTLGTGSSVPGTIALANTTNSNLTTIEAGAPGAAITYMLPTTAPTANQVLQSSAPVSNVATLSWTSAASGTVTGSSFTTEGVMYATSGTGIASTAALANGQILVGAGSSTAPSPATLGTSNGVTTAVGAGTLSIGLGAITPTSVASAGAVSGTTLTASTAASGLVLGSGVNATTFSSGATAARAISFPDAAGTVALTTSNVASATNIATTLNSATATAMYPTFVASNTTSNSQAANVATALSFVPSTGVLSATTFSGSGASLTSIPNSALTNNSITIQGTAVALGGTTLATTSTPTFGGMTLTPTGSTVGLTINGSSSGNDITGTNWSVTHAGAGTFVGLTNAGAAVSLNNSSNFSTSINTGTSTAAVHIADGTTGGNAITIGNAVSTTAVTVLAGSGNINIGTGTTAQTVHIADGAAANAVTLGSTTTTSTTTIASGSGGVLINNANNQPTSLNTGTSTGALHLADGGTGGNAITMGNANGATGITAKVGTGNFSLDGAATSTYAIGASTTSGTITIGGTGETGNLTLGSSTGTNTEIIAGGSGATTLQIANAQTGGSVAIGTAMTSGTITIGGAVAQTGTIILGQSTGTNTIDVGTGTGATTVDIATGATNAKTVAIANGAVANTVTIGSTTGAATTTLQAGTGGNVIVGHLVDGNSSNIAYTSTGSTDVTSTVVTATSDLSGNISVTPSATHAITAAFTFAKTFANAPIIVITPTNTNFATGFNTPAAPIISATSTSGFSVEFYSTGSGNAFTFNYIIMGQ